MGYYEEQNTLGKKNGGGSNAFPARCSPNPGTWMTILGTSPSKNERCGQGVERDNRTTTLKFYMRETSINEHWQNLRNEGSSNQFHPNLPINVYETRRGGSFQFDDITRPTGELESRSHDIIIIIIIIILRQ
ncbi:hypothetical protein CRE_26743 [Caenorhabditis remanei]|uniref:Uncharacterized protein n=1 Tax=Caenorhabditis remanei TaxID=31234 RepID=E3MXT4_CAERE|nr:hypothetical protein CRE_26743 [Caenorhabditis remanei]